MVLTALDLWVAGILPPPDRSPFDNGSPRFQYIVRRQVDALGPAVRSRLNPFAGRTSADDAIRKEWPKVRADLEAGIPSVIRLKRGPYPDNREQSHWALVIRAVERPGEIRLGIYDVNWPNRDDVELVIDLAGGVGAITQTTGEPTLVFVRQSYTPGSAGPFRDDREVARERSEVESPGDREAPPGDSESPPRDSEVPGRNGPALGPVPRIVRDYWTTRDELGYQLYADALVSLITHADTVPPLTIGIRAPWGAGKTSLMRMVRENLDPDPPSLAGESNPNAVKSTPNNEQPVTVRKTLDVLRNPPEKAQKPSSLQDQSEPLASTWRPTVWFNPWMYQSAGQVWAGLGSAVIKQVTERMTPIQREEFWLALNRRRVDPDAVRRKIYRDLFERVGPNLVVGVVAGGAAIVTGILAAVALSQSAPNAPGLTFGAIAAAAAAAASAANAIWKRRNWLEERVAGTYDVIVRQPDYEGNVGALQLLERDMVDVLELVATAQRPLVIFVDDVDRCSSRVVTEVVEAVNLFLASEFQNCIFVIAMEPDMVAAHLQVAYKDLAAELNARGSSISTDQLGWNFLDKVVQLPLTLPHPESDRVPLFVAAAFGPLDGASLPSTAAPGLPAVASSGTEPEEIARLASQALGAKPTGSVSELLEVARSVVQEAHPEDHPDLQAAMVREVTATASDKRFSDKDPEVLQLIQQWAERLWADNPREIKRFMNLYRFYAFLKVRREVAGLPVPSDDQLAKLAVISIKWPRLAGAFGRPVGATDSRRILDALEAELNAPTPEPTPPPQPSASESDGQDATPPDESPSDSAVPGWIWKDLAALPEVQALLRVEPTLSSGTAGFV
jgi:hypothetical protein